MSEPYDNLFCEKSKEPRRKEKKKKLAPLIAAPTVKAVFILTCPTPKYSLILSIVSSMTLPAIQ